MKKEIKDCAKFSALDGVSLLRGALIAEQATGAETVRIKPLLGYVEHVMSEAAQPRESALTMKAQNGIAGLLDMNQGDTIH